MRRILFAVIGCFTVFCAHAAQIVNVDYVHKLIAQEWDISVPIKTDNIMAAANMKYLLTAVDVANEILNGEKTTDYGNGEFATLHAADTIATNQAVETLVRKIDNITPAPEDAEYKFFLTTTPDTDSFSFRIIAAGEFYIDWGDGKTQLITKNDVEYTDYSYTYKKTGTYTIKLGGIATGYIVEEEYVEPAISFSSSASKIASIDGSLGAIFGTLSSDTNNQPRFYGTFSGATNMTGSIPAGLFAGISGAPASYMFAYTFEACSGLTGAIPDGLFGNLTGAPASSMFRGTFSGCSGLTGAIPDGLFAGISGAPASYMFYSTFHGCSGLTSIPENLFAGISGAPAIFMFQNTFLGCSGLTSIPENLFAGISGAPVAFMFYSTFNGCTSLTGPSARINGKYLYEIWPNADGNTVAYMYYGCTNLSDYNQIPIPFIIECMDGDPDCM